MKKVYVSLMICAMTAIAGGCSVDQIEGASEYEAADAEELTFEDFEAEAKHISATADLSFRLSPVELLGKFLFFDENLSRPRGQSCAACHAPETGFTGAKSLINMTTVVYPGAVRSLFGNRKPPASAYGGDSPILGLDGDTWIGGMFWDGRATGSLLGDPLAEQAQGPFLNPLEQNLPDVKTLVREVRKSKYAGLYNLVWGRGSLNSSDLNRIFERIARSIAAYERSAEVDQFSSKYDAYLKGKAALSSEELQGLNLFNDPAKGNCAECHPSAGVGALFTDFSYDNLGIPRNPDNPFYRMPAKYNPDGAAWVDPGIGGFLNDPDEMGKHKVPTLRNVDKRPYKVFVKAYGHNGYFKSLKDIVHFYNTRDVATAKWPAPEVQENVNRDELGDLGLSADEEAAIVAFLRTLSDGYRH